MGLLKQEHKDGGQYRGGQKLVQAEGDAIHLGAVMSHQKDLHRKQQGAEQQLQLAHREGEGIPARHAEQIQPRHAHRHPQPDAAVGAAAQDNAAQRHQHHIQGGEKAGLGGGDLPHSHLLGGRRGEQEDAAENAAPHRIAAGRRGHGRADLADRGQTAAHQQQAREKDTGQPAAAGQEGIGPHIAAAHRLGGEGHAPDQRPQHKQGGFFHLSDFHLHSPFLVGLQRPPRGAKSRRHWTGAPCPGSPRQRRRSGSFCLGDQSSSVSVWTRASSVRPVMVMPPVT